MWRIIPTHVGSTYSCIEQGTHNPNHSHACGINVLFVYSRFHASESFPRMWDQHALRVSLCRFFRIIPTHVGSTSPGGVAAVRVANHSHACGINHDFNMKFPLLCESFPRMWDQLLVVHPLPPALRIIPTHVGSTLQIAFTLVQAIQHLVVLCHGENCL